MKWRLLFVAALIVCSVAAWFIDPSVVSVPGLVGSFGLLFTSVVATWAAVQASAPHKLLLTAQILVDTLCIGLIVHFTGGPLSVFPLVYCVPIMLAANYLDARWSVAVAGLASILTGGGHFGLALGWLMAGKVNDQAILSGWPVFVTALHMSLFIVTGMISGELARRLAYRRHAQFRANVQVRESQCEVRNILDNMRSGLITVDVKGVITRVNPSCCGILKLPELELTGKNVALVMADGMSELAGIIMPVALGAEAVSRGEIKVRRYGREIPLGLNVNHVTGPKGSVIGAIAIFTDLTQEKELSAHMREADRLAAIGELSASIAHEIRNPLSSIRGSVEMLAGELDLDGYQKQLLDLVLKESGRVNTIINDFLGYSRMQPASFTNFSGRAWRDEITLQIQQHVNAMGGQVRVRCEVNPARLRVTADQGQLTQMALNLAINACQAMSYKGELELSVNLIDEAQNIELVVADNGSGIDPDIRNDLFSPFKTTKEQGTGLGLSTVARIAAGHGGRVRAEDGANGGATFRVRWPVNHDCPQAVPSEKPASPVSVPGLVSL
ncbi:MAG: two-component system sensor histidine kinase PilS (NtrC family) [Candidatus Krumholzibacteriia bacterium]|jgi:two-component system sensor histidine kinase PilS (NtrC family)